jgi:hypothetical protein
MRRRILDQVLRRDGNRRCGRNRREQKDRLAEQLGSAPRREQGSAEAVDELEERRDRGPDLRARRSARITDEREELARRVNLVEEPREPHEAR